MSIDDFRKTICEMYKIQKIEIYNRESKMNKKIENLEIYIKLGFIFISILSMSSLIYNKVEIFYKVLTLGTILITFVVFFKNYKKNIFDKPFILLIFGLFATQTITAFVNRSGNFFGNNRYFDRICILVMQ